MDTVNEVLSDITVFNKYAKFNPALGKRETWTDIVMRNCEMHVQKYPHLEQEIYRVYSLFVLPKKVLPSMRSLQFGGRPIEVANNRIYNCAYAPVDHMDFLSELMFLLLGGTGGGFSVQKHHVDALPIVQGPTEQTRKFLVGDSIEGWADAIKVLVESHLLGKQTCRFDVSDIRPKGAALVTTGGKAPGPEPLKACLDRIDKELTRARGRKLTTLEAHDICCIIADAVLAGGIRRAALISLFDRNDESMLTCKGNFELEQTVVTRGNNTDWFHTKVEGWYDYRQEYVTCYLDEDQTQQFDEESTVAWYHLEPQRGRANNSAVLPRSEVSYQEFMEIMHRVEDSKAGEPGVYWTNDVDWGTNPCCEIGLRPYQFCNLCEVNADDIVDQTDLIERAKAAAFIGTLQAGYTDFHYLRPVWRETTEVDALIGVGMTGIGSGAVLDLNLKEAAHEVINENNRVANLIGINSATRTTTVKPSGTSSLVVGSSSGIHAWHDEYYLRRMRLGKNEALYEYLVRELPALVEDDKLNPSNAVAAFPQKAPIGAILRTETPQELLERVRRFNVEWVRSGHIDGNNTHNVSCTISVKDDEWSTIAEWMWSNRDVYNGISVLPYDGGSYIQAPFETITKEQYEDLVDHLHAVDLTQITEEVDNTDLSGEAACGGGGCETM